MRTVIFPSNMPPMQTVRCVGRRATRSSPQNCGCDEFGVNLIWPGARLIRWMPPQEYRLGTELLGRKECSACHPESRGTGAFAVDLLKTVDTNRSRGGVKANHMPLGCWHACCRNVISASLGREPSSLIIFSCGAHCVNIRGQVDRAPIDSSNTRNVC